MSAETAPATPSDEEQARGSGVFSTAVEILKSVGRDEHVRTTLRKIGDKGLRGAGVMHKDWLSGERSVDQEGVAQAIEDPKAALLRGAEGARWEVPKLAFHAGRAAVNAIFERLSPAVREAPATNLGFAAAGPAESVPPSFGGGLSDSSELNFRGPNQAAGPRVAYEISDQAQGTLTIEHGPPIGSDSTAGVNREQVTFTSPAAGGLGAEQAMPLNLSSTAGPVGRPPTGR